MNYHHYMPPEPDPEAHHQYQYAERFPEQHGPNVHDAGVPVFDGSVHDVNYPADPNAFESEHGIAFEDAHSQVADHRDPRLGEQQSASRSMKVDTVYKKAPGAPKRFKSSYVHFFTNFVEKKKQQLGPDGLPVKLDIGEVSKECSYVWKKLPPQDKKYWEYVSEKEKEEYNRQKDNYQGPWRIATDKVKHKDPSQPKRSPSAFFLFVNRRRLQLKMKYPDMPHTEVVKTLGKIWAQMPESEKEPFRDEEIHLREQYKVDVAHWKREVKQRQQEEKEQKQLMKDTKKRKGSKRAAAEEYDDPYNPNSIMSIEQPQAAEPVAVEKEMSSKRRKKQDPDAPKRSPPAFFLFVNHHRPELKMQFPEMPHTELIKMCGARWEQMTEEDKKPFRDHEEVLRQQYHIDVQNYKRKAVPQKEYNKSLQQQPVHIPGYNSSRKAKQEDMAYQQNQYPYFD